MKLLHVLVCRVFGMGSLSTHLHGSPNRISIVLSTLVITSLGLKQVKQLRYYWVLLLCKQEIQVLWAFPFLPYLNHIPGIAVCKTCIFLSEFFSQNVTLRCNLHGRESLVSRYVYIYRWWHLNFSSVLRDETVIQRVCRVKAVNITVIRKNTPEKLSLSSVRKIHRKNCLWTSLNL